ncbi:MAG: UDP-N-acetylmuramoyl-tripeptide--D-alanyl-D-alanine ligase [candidate division WOR-3 bacterium]
MEPITIAEIINATQGRLIQGDKNYLIKNISIDTRKILPDDLFIAIKGKFFDGHSFIKQALERGACGILVDNQPIGIETRRDVNIIVVNNTIQALGDIASYYRKKFQPIVIAITGSNGKTTTKDMIAHILNQKHQVIKAPESFNNDIGVPLTVLQLTKDTEVLILEMEMNLLGGIKRLCEISLPQIGVITNIGDTHLEFLHNREGVLREKTELLEAVANTGMAILNADDPMLMQVLPRFKFKALYTFGIEKLGHFGQPDIFAKEIIDHYEKGTEFLLCGKYLVRLNVPGIYNIYNALAAISVARAVGFEFEEIISKLSDFLLPRMRMEKIEINGITIYNDAFNANPQSMISALNTFAKFTKGNGKKIAVLSDMLELGDKSIELHKWVGETFPEGIDILLTVGEQAKYIAESAQDKKNPKQIFVCNNNIEAVHNLVDIINIGDKILIKGSRLMRLEELTSKLKEYYFDTKSKNR